MFECRKKSEMFEDFRLKWVQVASVCGDLCAVWLSQEVGFGWEGAKEEGEEDSCDDRVARRWQACVCGVVRVEV